MSALLAQAKALQAGGDVQGAEQAYRAIPPDDPDYFKALNNLGMLLEERGQVMDATACYLRALQDAPDEWLLHYNLGHALAAQDRLDASAAAYRRALALCPSAADAAYNLGHTLRRQGDQEQAAQAFAQATHHKPEFFEAWSQLGNAQFQQGRVREALAAFSQTAQLNPESAVAHFDVGKCLEVLGELEQAVDALHKSLALRPESGAAREHLGRVLRSLGREEEARAVYREWLALIPGDATAEHMLATLDNPQLARPDTTYVRETFDTFSTDYNNVLERLEYAGPTVIQALLDAHLPREAQNDWCVLDAGCGSGLCAPVLRPWASTLEGVDLSPAMLALAEDTQAYDALHEADLIHHLGEHGERFDLIAAADTFNYFGDLAELLQGARGALLPGGHLAFTLERDDAIQGYRLTESGRYVHGEAYLRDCLARAELEPLAIDCQPLRREYGRPVNAWVVLCARPR